MIKNKFIPISKAKAKLLALVRTMNETGESYILTKDGEPKGVLLPPEVYAAYIETMEIQENPKLMAKLKQALAEEKKERLWTRDKKGRWIKYSSKSIKKAA